MLPRRFIRHPADIPIEYSLRDASASRHPYLTDVGYGGICFRADTRIEPGTRIHIRIPVGDPAFEAEGVVVWCRRRQERFQVGMQFDEETTRFSVRMVEQICHIEQYRKDMLKREGRYLSGAQAAAEWVKNHAADFPALH